MKQIYTSLYALVLLFSISVPLNSQAQCLCSGAVPATVITYLDTVLPTQASSTIFSFPKFDPSIGTLTCIDFNDTISVAVTTAARNTDTTKAPNYVFQTTISDSINGPDDCGAFDWLIGFGLANNT